MENGKQTDPYDDAKGSKLAKEMETEDGRETAYAPAQGMNND